MEKEIQQQAVVPGSTLPVGFVPTPTREYREHRKTLRITLGPGLPATPIPIPNPALPGSRVLIWKQDPSVREIGVRKAYLPGHILPGPRDARITVQGLPPVSPNVSGDLIEAVGTDAFDAIHTFAVVRSTLTMFQRALQGAPTPWQWNSLANMDPLNLFPHAAGVSMNAFYSRNQKALKFGFFDKPSAPTGTKVFTCRSLDIVAHETGHAVLDGLKPNWLLTGNPPQTGGLHESFGDLTAIFLALSQIDQVEAIIAQTKTNLHDKTFIADLAEEFGLALGRPNGLRNADNDLKLSQVGTEVHDLSQVFTGGVYDALADIFAFEQKPAQKDDAAVLYETGQYLCGLLLRAIIRAPNIGATYADVVNQMLQVLSEDNKPVQYRNFLRNRFVIREVFTSTLNLQQDLAEGVTLAAGKQDASGAVQSRRACCGTMQLYEYNGAEAALQADLAELKKVLAENGSGSSLTKTAVKGKR